MSGPTTTQRGYGQRHQQLRLRWKRHLKQEGQLPCARCLQPVLPTDEWELDHDDDNRDIYIGISHKFCNRRAGGVKAQATRITVRKW